MLPLTCQCDGAGWVAAAHRVLMDTLCVWLGLIRGFTLLSRHHSLSLSIADEFNSEFLYEIFANALHDIISLQNDSLSSLSFC